MALERSDVEKIAHLARLGLTESEIPQTTATLNNILGLIDAMQAVDTAGIVIFDRQGHIRQTYQDMNAPGLATEVLKQIRKLARKPHGNRQEHDRDA